MTASHRTEQKHFFHQWLIHGMVLLALAGFIAHTQFAEYHRIDSQERERLAVQAEIAARNLAPQFILANRVIDGVLRELPAWQAERGGMQRANRQLKLMNDTLIGIHPIVLAGADGTVVASSDASLVGRSYAGNPAYQEALRHPPANLLNASPSYRSTLDRRSISLARRVAGADGRLADLVMVSMEPDYFARLLDSMRYAPDVLSAISAGDGQLLMMSPPAAGSDRQRLAARNVLQASAPVAGTALQISISRDPFPLFAPWRRGLYVQSILFGFIAVISTLGLASIQRRLRAQRAERKKAEARIEQLAFFDQLTRLPNRILLLERLKQAKQASLDSGQHGAILFIDLDNFKTLNDTLGHDMGDLLLIQVAQRLNACVRAGDTVARLGGDEFVVMLTGLRGDARDAAQQVEVVGNKILQELSQAYQLNQVSYRSSSSIGATLFLGHQSSIDDLLKQADLAMYQSKAVGRNALRFFDPEMEVTMRERAALETDLREAIALRQLSLHYQPQFDLTGRMTGVEALLRWQHPRRGAVPPAAFIPLAEEIGVILAIGQWVLETACRQLLAWEARADTRHLSIAVNVSVRQFNQDDFVEDVLAVLAGTGANPRRLKLELTESLLVADIGAVIEKMSALKARGVGFSLDDFGTGYSSLAYLKRLPLDQLKIDRSFIRDVLHDQNDASIAKTIITLANSLHIAVIAEGVETREQRDFLARCGCHAYQGFFFSPPLPLAAFERYLRQLVAFGSEDGTLPALSQDRNDAAGNAQALASA